MPSFLGRCLTTIAAADGIVEMVISDMTQDRSARMRRPRESDEEYSRRIGELNRTAYEEHGLGGATGNLVVLHHANGERTAYGHLAAGSIAVAVGDTVHRGQPIGAVGDTGDSATVHLHFQVMEPPSGGGGMRSIPFRFEGVDVVSREYGSWVRPAD